MFSKEGLLSIVIPFFNEEKYIKESIESLLVQSFSDFEVICVDDGSTDRSAEIVEEIAQKDGRVQLIRQENQNAGVARNNGLKQAIGKYVIFFDADDYVAEKYLEKMYSCISLHDADICICNCIEFDDARGEINQYSYGSLDISKVPDKEVFSVDDIPDSIFQISMGWAWDKIYKREFIEENHLQFQDTKVANDQLFVDIAFATAQRITVLDERLVIHRKNVKTSLEYTKDQWWKCIFEMLYAEERELTNRGLFEITKKSFYNRACMYISANAYAIKSAEYFTEFFNYYRSSGMSHFEFSKISSDYFYNQNEYSCMKMMEESTEKEFLLFLKNDFKARHDMTCYELRKYDEAIKMYEGRVEKYEKIINELENKLKIAGKDKNWYFTEERYPAGKRYVLYGYGKVGKDFARQLLNSKHSKLVAVIDQDSCSVDRSLLEGVSVGGMEILSDVAYDYVIISPRKVEVAEQIKADLLRFGVPEDKIICPILDDSYS